MDAVETTGSRVYRDLDGVLDFCRRVNAHFIGEIEQRPVKFELGPTGKPCKEIKDHRRLMGLSHPRRKRQLRASEAPQGVRSA